MFTSDNRTGSQANQTSVGLTGVIDTFEHDHVAQLGAIELQYT